MPREVASRKVAEAGKPSGATEAGIVKDPSGPEDERPTEPALACSHPDVDP